MQKLLQKIILNMWDKVLLLSFELGGACLVITEGLKNWLN